MGDIQNVAALVSSVGFPIVACIALFYANDKLRTALEENTKIITELKVMIDQLLDRFNSHTKTEV